MHRTAISENMMYSSLLGIIIVGGLWHWRALLEFVQNTAEPSKTSFNPFGVCTIQQSPLRTPLFNPFAAGGFVLPVLVPPNTYLKES